MKLPSKIITNHKEIITTEEIIAFRDSMILGFNDDAQGRLCQYTIDHTIRALFEYLNIAYQMEAKAE